MSRFVPLCKFTLYMEKGLWELENDEKAVVYSGDFTVTNEVEVGFEPDLNIAVKTSRFHLESADLVAKANISLANTLTIEASAAGNLNKTVTLLEREFIKIFAVGGVPVVVRGVYALRGQITGHVSGAAKLTKKMEVSFPDTTFGVQFRNGIWEKVNNFTPKYSFTVEGEASADAEIEVALIPDLQIHFYESASGRLLIEPALYAEAGIHGQFKYQDSNGNVLADPPDYWFTHLNAGISLKTRLYTGFYILDYNIASWPKDTHYLEVEKFTVVELITREEGKMYSLPTLETVIDYTAADLPDSRAIFVSGKATDHITPVFGWNLNPFDKWTDFTVVSAQNYQMKSTGIAGLFQVPPRSGWWFIPEEAGDFIVRLFGHSKLGWFVRQTTGDKLISLPDDNHNGLPDYWESRFDLAHAIDDNDGMSNLEEFNHGTDPTKLDSDGDGVSDGQELRDGSNPLDDKDKNNHAVLTLTDATVTEGDAGTKNITFTLRLDQFKESATVEYTTQDGTATLTGNDYTETSGTISFTDGSTSKTVTVTIQSDTDVELDETFSLVLSNPVNLTLANTSVTATIVNDDSITPSVLTLFGSTISEGDNGIKTLDFTLALDQFYESALVDYTTHDGTATAVDNDYIADTGTVSFTGGSTSETVSIQIQGDTAYENDETIFIVLSNPINLALANDTATGTITNDDPIEIKTVTSAGQVWMDRNLGATRVATSSTDSEAYGDLYQWGRGSDGHEHLTSPIITVLSDTESPGHGDWITPVVSPFNWISSSYGGGLWSGASGINNPCPDGFRLPTEAEFEIERLSWFTNDSAGAYDSPLKLPLAGYRSYEGSTPQVGEMGFYWTSDVNGPDYSRFLQINVPAGTGMLDGYRADGNSVRCIQDSANCDVSNLNLCSTESDCTDVGGNWYSDSCFQIARTGDPVTSNTAVDIAITMEGIHYSVPPSTDYMGPGQTSDSAFAKAASLNNAGVPGFSATAYTSVVSSIGPIGGTAGDTYNLTINGEIISIGEDVSSGIPLVYLRDLINMYSSTTGVVSTLAGDEMTLTAADGRNIIVTESGVGFTDTYDGLSGSENIISGIPIRGYITIAANQGLTLSGTITELGFVSLEVP